MVEGKVEIILEKITYNYNKICKKCGRELPYSYLYFPYDKNCKNKLRNICRECNPKYKQFLTEDYCPNKKWSDGDIEILAKYYKLYTNEELQEKFFPSRTIKAIESMASKYGYTPKSQDTIERGLKAGAVKNPMCQKGRIVTDIQRQHMSDAQKKRYQDTEQRRIASDLALKNGRWQGDNHPIHLHPLYGSSNGRWKGGCSDSIAQFRRDIIDWKRKSSEFCNYKCVITGERFQNIHHLISFNQILETALSNVGLSLKPYISDYSENEYQNIKNELIILHENTLYGACLNSTIHTLFHKEYSYYNSTIENFIDFCHCINDGKYNNFFRDNGLLVNINHDYVDYLNASIS